MKADRLEARRRAAGPVLGALCVVTAAASIGCSGQAHAGSPSRDASRAASANPNLLPNSSFEQPSDQTGTAAGLTAWGDATLALLQPGDNVDGRWVQRITVAPAGTGGAWFQVPAVPLLAYTGSVYLKVSALPPGAHADFILEWYDNQLRLLDYETKRIDVLSTGYERREITARSPDRTALVRFVVNVAGGGTIDADAAKLEIGPVATAYSAGSQATPPVGPSVPPSGAGAGAGAGMLGPSGSAGS